MTQPANESRSPSLFTHKNRKDWGVGVLAWEANGKRGYLFDNGEERTMASGFFELMRGSSTRVRKRTLLAAGCNGSWPHQRALMLRNESAHTFADHVEKFSRPYPTVPEDPKWLIEVRGEGAERRAPHTAMRRSRGKGSALLCSPRCADQPSRSTNKSGTWSRPCSAAPISCSGRSNEEAEIGHRRAAPRTRRCRTRLAPRKNAVRAALRALPRALAGFFGEPARWEMATALSALVHPKDMSASIRRFFASTSRQRITRHHRGSTE